MASRPSCSPATITVVPVESAKSLEAFIRLPWRVFEDDPHWIAPLLVERRDHLAASNPYFEHARWQPWLAYQDGQPVGRICAQIDQLHQERYQNHSGFFGMLDAVDNPAVFDALFSTAEGWLRDQGMTQVLGPFNLSVNQECGLLVEGFDTPPQVMMGHARPYYGERVLAAGYQPVKDLLAYRLSADFEPPPAMAALARKSAEQIRLRPLDRRHLLRDLDLLQDIFNDAWSENWQFLPFTQKEFRAIGRDLTRLLPADYIRIAEVQGEPAAMIVLLPNLNEAAWDLGGKLLPLGWLKLLWRLKIRHPSSARVPLMGIRKRFQHSLIGTALALLTIDALRQPARQRGIREVELSWILEDNGPMRNLIEALGGEVYKTYRMYHKHLTTS